MMKEFVNPFLREYMEIKRLPSHSAWIMIMSGRNQVTIKVQVVNTYRVRYFSESAMGITFCTSSDTEDFRCNLGFVLAILVPLLL